MILVDTSVWIDYLAGRTSAKGEMLHMSLGSVEFAIGDLILAEVLQGVREGAGLRALEAKIRAFRVMPLCGEVIARAAAANYRKLRSKGITIRGTIDVIIATWCIENGVPLLHNDRDFALMESELGLKAFGTQV
ncbi:type II toxin-antitoxin system VapC family toxin [Mesorhizobium sp. CN2-181]|uniref:type II toxin-antitoxin system VapC family toxin n=1 Tax=Mesorhizobium yinganensis TaxID=3157707 RepID=UPI0032B7686F